MKQSQRFKLKAHKYQIPKARGMTYYSHLQKKNFSTKRDPDIIFLNSATIFSFHSNLGEPYCHFQFVKSLVNFSQCQTPEAQKILCLHPNSQLPDGVGMEEARVLGQGTEEAGTRPLAAPFLPGALSRHTCKPVSLWVEGNVSLWVEGNGTYSLPLGFQQYFNFKPSYAYHKPQTMCFLPHLLVFPTHFYNPPNSHCHQGNSLEQTSCSSSILFTPPY